MSAQIPWRELWLDAVGVAELTGYAPRYVVDTLSKRPDFPAASGTGNQTRRWKAGEIDDWMQQRIARRSGRPRLVR